MNILLTGGGGQVGRMLLERAPASFRVLAPPRGALDLLQPPTIAHWLAQAPDLVVNAAAFTAVDRAETEVAAAFAANRDGAAELAKQCAARDVPIIHLSTDYVFDGEKEGAYIESDATNPISVYGQSKLEGEIGVREANPRHVILRCSWVFGPHGSNFVRSVLERAMRGDDLRIVDDQRGCPTPTELIAAVVFALAHRYARNGALPWGLYHCAGRETVTRFAFARAALEEARQWLPKPPRMEPIKTGDYAVLARRPANSALDCALLADRLGIKASSWRTPLAATVAAVAGAFAAPTTNPERP